MILFYLFLISIFLILVKLVLYLFVKKYGKFSYDGFSAAGFLYKPDEDIFYSTKNAWQKNFGYAHIYDVLAPIFRMIIDTEPIRFYYNNKNWLITFWKGQYGIVTGAEVGIYCTTQKKVNKKTLYLPANDNEMLKMNLVLYKNGEEIAKINATHWWLAIFKLGMFSKPKELTMDINITFLDKNMLASFLKSFHKLGYRPKDYVVNDNTFCFKYIKPRTHKVWTRTWLTDSIRQYFNRKNVELYNKYLSDFIDDNKIDDSKKYDNRKLIMVNDYLPNLVKNAGDKEKHSIIKEKYSKKYIESEKSIVFLNSNVYPKNKGNNHE